MMKTTVYKKYIGVWFISNNGYLPWSTTVPPFKRKVTYKHICFPE